MLCSGCSWVSGLFGGSNPDKGVPVSVFDVAVGDCFQTITDQKDVRAELSSLTKVSCTVPHQQEAYAIIQYTTTGATSSATTLAADAAFPGQTVLDTFAKGACATAYTDYVGVTYLDSQYYFTYLLPSARGWQQGDDRSVTCFVITTGRPLTATVKGTKE